MDTGQLSFTLALVLAAQRALHCACAYGRIVAGGGQYIRPFARSFETALT